VLTRDYDSVGSVTIDSDGNPRMHFALSRHDEGTITRGLEAASKVLIAAGARLVRTSQNAVPSLDIQDCMPSDNPQSSPQFKKFVEDIKSTGMPVNSNFLGCVKNFNHADLRIRWGHVEWGKTP
jgi:hypothetical protein